MRSIVEQVLDRLEGLRSVAEADAEFWRERNNPINEKLSRERSLTVSRAMDIVRDVQAQNTLPPEDVPEEPFDLYEPLVTQ